MKELLLGMLDTYTYEKVGNTFEIPLREYVKFVSRVTATGFSLFQTPRPDTSLCVCVCLCAVDIYDPDNVETITSNQGKITF